MKNEFKEMSQELEEIIQRIASVGLLRFVDNYLKIAKGSEEKKNGD